MTEKNGLFQEEEKVLIGLVACNCFEDYVWIYTNYLPKDLSDENGLWKFEDWWIENCNEDQWKVPRLNAQPKEALKNLKQFLIKSSVKTIWNWKRKQFFGFKIQLWPRREKAAKEDEKIDDAKTTRSNFIARHYPGEKFLL